LRRSFYPDWKLRRTAPSWFFLTNVEVEVSENARAVVALGDSITDGTMSTPNTNSRFCGSARFATRHITSKSDKAGCAAIWASGDSKRRTERRFDKLGNDRCSRRPGIGRASDVEDVLVAQILGDYSKRSQGTWDRWVPNAALL
jgi:hypothetical protein